ncbi:calcium-dependent protein kinase 6 [Diabrotica virgifera virgifera]|uniref:Probable myosin light chain kinase DDB_G0279831 n=1 Tax=Diabrotica virgifera virgifera TaxID=50390 RepID=A0A6P7G437_DIAVI|nr:calcium-dependent protein kinase 6 [Diabrotica virgifera virgifera]
MSWLKYPEKLFEWNEKIQYNTKEGIHLPTDKNSTRKKGNTTDTTNKNKNCSKSIIHGETSKQQSNATGNIQTTKVLANASKSDDKNNTGPHQNTILKKRTSDKTGNEDTNNSGEINSSVLTAKDPTNQLESKENTSSMGKPKNAKKQKKRKNKSKTMSTVVSCVKDPTNPLESRENSSSGGKPKDVNLPTDNSIILEKEQSNIKENAEKNNGETIINGTFGFVKGLTNALESNKNTSSESKCKEVNLCTGKTSKKEKKGKNSSQTMSISDSCLKDSTNPLQSKENISSVSKPEEINLPTENSMVLKEEKTDKINSQTINPLKIPKKPIENLNLSWVNNPKKLLETEEGASCSNITKKSKAKTENTSLPKNTSHNAAKNNLLHLDIVEQVIKNIKSNKEFKSVLEIVSNIMSNKNFGNRKTKCDLFEIFLEHYQYANPNYMKQAKETLTYCESHVPIASYFMDANDFEEEWGADLNYFGGKSKMLKGVISKNNVKREAVILYEEHNNCCMTRSHDKYIENEAAMLCQLKHPNIIELLGYDPKRKIIILEYMNHLDLARGLLNERVDLSIRNVQKILIDLLTGLEYLHSQKILHRDLNLKHFLFNDNNEYKIGALGKAVYVGNSSGVYQSSVPTLTRRLFDAPEWRGTKTYTYTYKTDVWTMGCYFKIILNKRSETFRLCRDEITDRLKLFVTNFMLAANPGSRKDSTELKSFLQNTKI